MNAVITSGIHKMRGISCAAKNREGLCSMELDINSCTNFGSSIFFFADHIRALTESFKSKLADAGNPLVRQLGRYLS
jgi:hypothetical protein